MKKMVLSFCREKESCSLAILKAASLKYNFLLSKELIDSCNAISSGFGIGGICSSLVASVMVIGILFQADKAKEVSLIFLYKIQEIYKSLDCCKLSFNKDNCNELMGEFADILEKTIEENK